MVTILGLTEEVGLSALSEALAVARGHHAYDLQSVRAVLTIAANTQAHARLSAAGASRPAGSSLQLPQYPCVRSAPLTPEVAGASSSRPSSPAVAFAHILGARLPRLQHSDAAGFPLGYGPDACSRFRRRRPHFPAYPSGCPFGRDGWAR